MIPKFRAYIIAEKRYFPVTKIRFDDLSQELKSVEVYVGNWAKKDYRAADVIIEMSSGLLDKNGTIHDEVTDGQDN